MAAPDSSRGRYSRARADVARAFGQVLREFREARGLTQEALANRAGFDRTYPSLLERGFRTPTLTVIFRLAEALSVSAAQLIQETADRLARQRPP